MNKMTTTLPKDVAKRFNAAIRKQRRREQTLIKQLGADRVEELRRFAAKEMEPRAESEFKRNMTWVEKELVWLWRLIECARNEQVQAWRESVLGAGATANAISSVSREETPACQSWKRGRRRGRVHAQVNQQVLERILAA